MLDFLFAVKFFLTVGIVLGVSWVAERFSPRIAGIIAGLPTGTAIIMFFFGLEHGAQFAADSVVYNVVGFIAGLTQFYAYYQASKRFKRFGVPLCFLSSLATYLTVAFVLHQFAFTIWTAALALCAAIFFFLRLYREVPNHKIGQKIKLTKRVIAFRATVAGLMVVVVTTAAQWVGPAWAGLLSAISVTTIPLLLILHHTYGMRPVHTIIKNFPLGLFATLAYNLGVHFAFPIYGIYWGTAIAYAATLAYLVAYLAAKKRWAWLP